MVKFLLENQKKIWDVIGGGLVVLATMFLALVLVSAAKAEGNSARKGRVAAEQQDFLPVNATDKAPWSGLWAGINLGYAAQSTELAGVSFDAKDVTYCGALGYDHQIAGTKIVVGLMGDYCGTKAKSMLAEYDRSWFLGGRGGLLLSESMLLYGLVGYTSLDGSAPVALPFSVDYEGLTLGGGIEALVTKRWSFKVEYRYIDLGSDKIGGPFSAEHSQNDIRFGAAYRF